MDSPLKHFADLRARRVERAREHLLQENLLMTIAAVLSGANGWNEIEDYAHSKHAWFKSSLTLPSGIPSHDTVISPPLSGMALALVRASRSEAYAR